MKAAFCKRSKAKPLEQQKPGKINWYEFFEVVILLAMLLSSLMIVYSIGVENLLEMTFFGICSIVLLIASKEVFE